CAGGPTLTGLRFAIALAVLAVPTVAMGATFPVLVREAVARGASPDIAVSLLYGVNATGAAAGALLGSFAALPLLGTRLSFGAAAMLNLLAGTAALLLPGGRPAAAPAGAHGSP